MHDSRVWCGKLWFRRDPNQTTSQPARTNPSIPLCPTQLLFRGNSAWVFNPIRLPRRTGLPPSPYVHSSTSKRICMGVRPSDLLSGLTPRVRKPVGISRLGCTILLSGVGNSGFGVIRIRLPRSQPGPTLPSLCAQPNSCFEETLLGSFTQSDYLAGRDCLHPHMCIPAPLRESAWGFAHPTSYQD